MGKNYWELYFNAVKNQKWEEALNSLNFILKTEPKNPQVHLKIGDTFQKLGDIASAVSAYHQSAWLLIKQGFLQKALAIFKIILRLDPNNAEAINKSKELMMEIESSKLKAPALPAFEPQPAEKTEQEAVIETVSPEGIKAEVETVKVEAPVRIEDLLERTSFAEQPATPTQPSSPVEIKEEGDIKSVIPSFLESLPESEANSIISKIKPQFFSAGQRIVEEGDSGDSIFAIKSGSAKVIAHILGKEIELASLSAGDVFGEVAFLTGRPRTASVVATEDLEVIEFNRFVLEDIFTKHPEILTRLQDFYQSHVQSTLEKVKTGIKK